MNYDRSQSEVTNYSKMLETIRNSDPKKNKDREKQIQNLGNTMDRINKEKK